MRGQRGHGTVIAAALLLGLVDAVAGAERAVEITSPHFVVYSNAGETVTTSSPGSISRTGTPR